MNLSTKNTLILATIAVGIFVAGIVFTLTIGFVLTAALPEEPEKSALPQPAQEKIPSSGIPNIRSSPTPENRIIPSRRPNIPPVRVAPVVPLVPPPPLPKNVADNAPSLEELRLQFESWVGRQRLSPEAGAVLRQWSNLSPSSPTREQPTDLERSQFRDTLDALDRLSRSHSVDMASFGRYQQISRDVFGLPSRVVVQTGLTSMVMAGWWKQSHKTSQENVQEIARRFHALQINALVQPSSQRLGVIARLWAAGKFQGKEWQGLEGEIRIMNLARVPERQWRETLQQLGIDPRVDNRYSFQPQENREAIIKAGWSGLATRMQAAETKGDILDTLQVGALASGVFGGNREAIETFGKDLLDTLQQVHKEDASLFEDPKKREQLYKTLADKMKGSAAALGIGPDQLQKAIQSSYSGLEENVRLRRHWREMYGNVSRLIGLTDIETLRQVLPHPNLESAPGQNPGQRQSAAPAQSRNVLAQNQPLPLPPQRDSAQVFHRNGPFPCPQCGGTGQINWIRCSFCMGRGFEKCWVCGGTGHGR
jgi:hypothetical protein